MLIRTFKLRLVGLFEPNSNARRGGHQLSIHTLGGKHRRTFSRPIGFTFFIPFFLFWKF